VSCVISSPLVRKAKVRASKNAAKTHIGFNKRTPEGALCSPNCLVRRRLEVGRLLDGRLGVAHGLLQIALGFLPLALALERRIVGRFADTLLHLAGHLVCRTLGCQ
jgi:hypothetical protein